MKFSNKFFVLGAFAFFLVVTAIGCSGSSVSAPDGPSSSSVAQGLSSSIIGSSSSSIPTVQNLDSLPNCTPNREGNIVMVQSSFGAVVCKNGQWTTYEPPASSSSYFVGFSSSDVWASSSSNIFSSSSNVFSSSSVIEVCSSKLVGPESKWGYFGYVIPVTITEGAIQKIFLKVPSEAKIGGQATWTKFGVVIGAYRDASFAAGTEIYSVTQGSLYNPALSGNYVYTKGGYMEFDFMKTGTWLATIGAGMTVDLAIVFYAPEQPTDPSESISTMYYDYFSVPGTAFVANYEICYTTDPTKLPSSPSAGGDYAGSYDDYYDDYYDDSYGGGW